MSNLISRKFAVNGVFRPVSATPLVLTCELVAAPENNANVYLQGDDGAEVPLVPGQFHSLYGVDLNTVKVKGTAGDFVLIVGGAR